MHRILPYRTSAQHVVNYAPETPLPTIGTSEINLNGTPGTKSIWESVKDLLKLIKNSNTATTGDGLDRSSSSIVEDLSREQRMMGERFGSTQVLPGLFGAGGGSGDSMVASTNVASASSGTGNIQGIIRAPGDTNMQHRRSDLRGGVLQTIPEGASATVQVKRSVKARQASASALR